MLAAEYLENDSGFYTEESPIGGNSAYGKAKSAQTRIARATAESAGFDLMIARPFNLLGPNLSANLVMGKVCQALAAGASTIRLGRTDAQRDFLDIRDAARAYLDIVQKGLPDTIYNVCSARCTRISDLIDMAIAITGCHVEIESDSSSAKPGDVDRSYGNNDRVRRDTGWSPEISLEQSVRDQLRSYG